MELTAVDMPLVTDPHSRLGAYEWI